MRAPALGSLASVFGSLSFMQGGFKPIDDAMSRMARLAGTSTGGDKALRAYRTRYSHVMTAMATDRGLALIAKRRARLAARTEASDGN